MAYIKSFIVTLIALSVFLGIIRFAEEGICEDVKAYLLEEYGVRPGNVKARLDGEQSVKSLEITLYGEDDRNAIDEAALKVRYGAQELIIKTNESG